jgi:hypothetical protein
VAGDPESSFEALGEMHPDWEKMDKNERRSWEKLERERRLVGSCGRSWSGREGW